MADVRRLILGVAAFALTAGDARAQVFGASSGERVRVTAPNVSKVTIVGTVVQRLQDSLVVRTPKNARLAIANASIWKLERSAGSQPCSGVVPGLLTGLALGVVVAATDRSGAALLLAPVAGVVGMLVGYRVGHMFTCTRWVVVSNP